MIYFLISVTALLSVTGIWMAKKKKWLRWVMTLSAIVTGFAAAWEVKTDSEDVERLRCEWAFDRDQLKTQIGDANSTLNRIVNADSAEARQLVEKWSSGKRVDSGYRKLGGIPGRSSGVWYEPVVKVNEKGFPSVTIRYRAYCKSEVLVCGAKNTGRLKLGDVQIGSVSSSCGWNGKDRSNIKSVVLTRDQVRDYSPSDIKMSNDYR